MGEILIENCELISAEAVKVTVTLIRLMGDDRNYLAQKILPEIPEIIEQVREFASIVFSSTISSGQESGRSMISFPSVGMGLLGVIVKVKVDSVRMELSLAEIVQLLNYPASKVIAVE